MSVTYPIRQDIEVLPADPQPEFDEHIIIRSDNSGPSPFRITLGWKVSERIGIAAVNTRGIAAGRKSVVVGGK